MSGSKKYSGPAEPAPLSEILGRSLGRGFLNLLARKLRVFEVWPRAVGPEDAARTRASRFVDGRLVVLVPGPAWLDRYSYKKTEWLRLLNQELAGLITVEAIILRVGEFSPEAPGSERPETP